MEKETHMMKTQSATSLSATEKRAVLAKQQSQGDVGNGEVIEKGEEVVILANGETVNASGHQQELERNFVSNPICLPACSSIMASSWNKAIYQGTSELTTNTMTYRAC